MQGRESVPFRQKERVDFTMTKRTLKPGNLLYPLPAVLVSASDSEGHANLLTVAWTGTVSSDPAMVYISVRKSRYTHHMLKETGEFVINLTTDELIRATDYCGVRSGKDEDKWQASGLTPAPSVKVKAPSVLESPVNIECRVTEVLELGSHDMFLAEVVSMSADEALFDETDRLCLEKAHLAAYSHGLYQSLGDVIGSFGYSVKGEGKKK